MGLRSVFGEHMHGWCCSSRGRMHLGPASVLPVLSLIVTKSAYLPQCMERAYLFVDSALYASLPLSLSWHIMKARLQKVGDLPNSPQSTVTNINMLLDNTT
jgi:hypothetical protein